MEDTGKLILRLTMAGLILFHGISKIMHGVPYMAGLLAQFHLPAFIAYGVYIGEVVAPLFIIIGLWTVWRHSLWCSTWSWRSCWRPTATRS